MSKTIVMIVDDDSSVLQALSALLSDEYDVLSAASGEEALALIPKHRGIAVVVMDIRMPGMGGIEAARRIRTAAPDTAVIFHTGYPGDYDEDTIDRTEAPFEYLEKGGGIGRLLRSIRNAAAVHRARTDVLALSEQAERALGIIGHSAVMRSVFRSVLRIAGGHGVVMILGETGTGKGLIARAIHQLSNRCEKPFRKYNCNHTPPDLVESELFGHIKGSFTGAVSDRSGLFEQARGGTVLLDEIGDLSPASQGKILDVVENGEYEPLGWDGPAKRSDVRILCATNRDLVEMVKKRSFREDLYYRLSGIQIVMPPLRDRREDIPLLVRKFARDMADDIECSPKVFDQSAMDVLMGLDWPGNVRDLRKVVEALVTMTDSDIIVESDVTAWLQHSGRGSAAEHRTGKTLAERIDGFRRAAIVDALRETNGNRRAAARLLGIDPGNLRRWIAQYRISVE